jgi:UDP-glucuronate decarboxylase
VQALRGEDITLYGDGSQTRSFCYVDDLIEGFLRFMNLPNRDDGLSGFPGPMNLGNPNEFTIRQLAEKVIDLTGSKSKITFMPLPEDDPMQRKPNISLAKEYIQWEPKIELDLGLLMTVKYFDEILMADEIK